MLVAVPGPPDALWATALLVWALEGAVLGEAVRFVCARWVPLWRTAEPLERFLLDFFLGGAVLYLVAALPVGAFGRPVVEGLPIAAAGGLLALAIAQRRRGSRPAIEVVVRRLFGWGPLLAVLAALGLFAVELSAALGAATGNTFDSSLLTTYTALLLRHGQLPSSFAPYASPMILYPQGTTVWLGTAQLLFGLPPARTALLVTPLFLSLVPIAGFVLGRRLFASDRAGVAFALALAFLGPSTRSLVGGSNDLAISFPLVLLLAAQSTAWSRIQAPGWGDAIGWGVLLGYSAATNPVGADWLYLAIVGFGLVGGPRVAGRTSRWAARWAASLAAGLVPVVPTLRVLVLGLRSPGYVPGAASPPTPARTGISLAQLYGDLDPFLFRGKDVALSPISFVRAELAVLLVAGLALLLFVVPWPELEAAWSAFSRWSLAAGVSIAGWLLLLAAAGAGWPIARSIAGLSSGSELSIWLFSIYGLVAAVPLLFALERWDRSPGPERPGAPSGAARFRRARSPRDRSLGRVVPLAAALVFVVPGLVLTPTQLTPVLRTLYADFGDLSAGDFALLACAGANLPAGSRVLVAPGSAAEFLPGYAPDITLLYPLVPNWQWENGSYRLVVAQLSNGTLDAQGSSALRALHVGFVAVTQNNTVLWPAFSPLPFLRDPSAYPEVFRSGDAYLFSTTPGAVAFPCG